MRRLVPALSRLATRRWLGFGLVILTSSIDLHAQVVNPEPRVNLFGDEIIRKFRSQEGQVLILNQNPEEKKPETKQEGYTQALIFQNGSQLRGEIVSLTKDEIVWSRPDVSEPLRFRREDVYRVVLTPSPGRNLYSRIIRFPGEQDSKEEKGKSGYATVKLPGGDWLHGDVSSTDGQTINLKIDDQTSFTLNRNSICWLHSGPKPAPAFGFTGGPLDMEGWYSQTPNAKMEVQEGTLVVKGSNWIGRQVASLRRFELSFELPENAEENTRIWLQPYGPSVNSYTTGTIEMRLGRKEFRHSIFGNRIDNIVTPLPKEVSDKGPVRYRVLYDAPGERVIVIRNGQQLGEWKFTEEKDKAQNAQFNREFSVSGICFQRQQGQHDLLMLNRLEIQPWDGTLPQDSVVTGDGDCLLALNGARRAGKLEAISSNELTFSGEKFERKTGAFLQFAYEPEPLNKVDTRLLFGEQGELSAAELEIENGKARFTSVFAPSLETPVKALQTIAFSRRVGTSAPKPSDTLVFKNGDELPGFLVSAVNGEAWRWQMPGGQEIAIRPDHIAGFRSIVGETALAPGKETATVEFRNGDRLRGKVTGFHDGKVHFQHGELGALALDRNHLWSLYPNSRMAVVDGAQNPLKWMTSSEDEPDSSTGDSPSALERNRWIYLDGSYITRMQGDTNNSYYSKLDAITDKGLDRFELRFDVTHGNGGEPSLGLNLTSTKKDGGSLQAQFSGRRFYAYIYSSRARGTRSKQVQLFDKIPELTSRRNIRLFVDSKIGTVDVFIDGVFMMKIGQQEAERLPGIGGRIHLQPYIQDAPVIFSNIWVGPWNGEVPKDGAELVPVTSLTNGDVTNATPQDFRDGKLILDSEVGPLEVPMDKVLSVEFGGTMTSKSAAARIRLSDGCSFMVDAFRWEDSQLIAKSEIFGELKIPAKLVSELTLAPAPPRAPKNPPAKKVAQKVNDPAADAVEGDGF